MQCTQVQSSRLTHANKIYNSFFLSQEINFLILKIKQLMKENFFLIDIVIII